MQLEKVRLCTNDVSLLFNFYRDVLLMPASYTGSNSIAIKAGRSQLIFEKSADYDAPFYHVAFNIPSNNFEEAFRWLQSKAALTWLDEYNGYVADFVNWNARSVYFADPAGNILELIARFDLGDNSEEPFSINQIRCISEIGLVFPGENFDAEVALFQEEYPIKHFSRQAPMPHFRAVGDDNGLFIIVPQGRNWFGSSKPAGMFPMGVSFTNNNTSYHFDTPERFPFSR